jgi:aconitate hydratase
MTHNLFNTRQTFKTGTGADGTFYSLPQLEKEGVGNVSRLPISIRIVFESVLRNFDEKKISEERRSQSLANWSATAERNRRSSVRRRARHFAGFYRRSAARRFGGDAFGGRANGQRRASLIEPLVPVDLVIDHSVQVDYAGSEKRISAIWKWSLSATNSVTAF